MHFAMCSAGCVTICLLPCGPFAPIGSVVLQLVALSLIYLRNRAMTLRYYGLDLPIPWLMYAAIVCPTTLGALMYWRSARNQFLVQRLTQRRAEQLESEKERLDYERLFALHSKGSSPNGEEHQQPRSEEASDAPVSIVDVELAASLDEPEPAELAPMPSVQEWSKSRTQAASTTSDSTSNGELCDIEDSFSRRPRVRFALFSLESSSRRTSSPAQSGHAASFTEATGGCEPQGLSNSTSNGRPVFSGGSFSIAE